MDTLNQPPPPQPSVEQTAVPPKTPFHPQTFLIMLAGFIFIILALAIYLLKTTSKPSTSPVSPIINRPSPAPDPTANWKSYTNIKYEYSVKYPPSWDIENADFASLEKVTFMKQPSGKDIDIDPQIVSIIVEPNPQRNIPTIKWYKDEWAKQIPAGINFDHVKFEENTFQNLPALKANNTIFFARESYMFRAEWAIIDFGNTDPKLVELTKQTFDQILSTFQFLN